MKPERQRIIAGTKRFDTDRRHYHHSQKDGYEVEEWDEFLGEKVKSPLRKKMGMMFQAIGTLVVGCLLLAGIFAVLYFLMGKFLR